MDNENLNVTPEEVVDKVEEVAAEKVADSTVSDKMSEAVQDGKAAVEKVAEAAGQTAEKAAEVVSEAAEKFGDKVEAVAAEVIDNPEVKKADGLSIAGLVVGVVSIPLSCCVWACGLPVAIVALVLSIVGMKKQKCGLATAALVVSIIGFAICIIGVVLAMFSIGTGVLVDMMDSSYY